ncbi:MAG: hypothetical protein EBX50_06210 [Chitinophagia bacterium]|nr:hypothetical protein [Chitinophagia bacterium]
MVVFAIAKTAIFRNNHFLIHYLTLVEQPSCRRTTYWDQLQHCHQKDSYVLKEPAVIVFCVFVCSFVRLFSLSFITNFTSEDSYKIYDTTYYIWNNCAINYPF